MDSERPVRQFASVTRSCLTYFSILFGVGFLLGPLRVLMLEPAVGPRAAELIEAPIMLMVITITARWLSHWNRFHQSNSEVISELQITGLVTTLLILGADILVGLFLRDLSLEQIMLGRDRVAGTIYYLLLAITACAPFLMRQTGLSSDAQPRTRLLF